MPSIWAGSPHSCGAVPESAATVKRRQERSLGKSSVRAKASPPGLQAAGEGMRRARVAGGGREDALVGGDPPEDLLPRPPVILRPVVDEALAAAAHREPGAQL